MIRLPRDVLTRNAGVSLRKTASSRRALQRKLNYVRCSCSSHLLCRHSEIRPSSTFPEQALEKSFSGSYGTDGAFQIRPYVMAAIAAGATILAAEGDHREGVNALGQRRFEDVYSMAERAPVLGGGSYGTVSAAVHKETGEIIAVKRIPRSPEVTLDDIEAEVEVLKVAGEHRNITQFHELFMDDEYYYLAMEMARGGELFDLLATQGTPSEAQTAALLKALLKAVAYVHMHGITHGDIKPENVFLNEDSSTGEVDWNSVLLGDFGSAVEVGAGGVTTLARHDSRVTPVYSPPETLKLFWSGEDDDDVIVTPGGDIWALGIILYMLLTGHHPFAADMSVADDEIVRVVLDEERDEGPSGLFEITVTEELEGDGSRNGPKGGMADVGVGAVRQRRGRHAHISPLAMDLTAKMLRRDPAQRPSAQEVLQHPWFKIAGDSHDDNIAVLGSSGVGDSHDEGHRIGAAAESIQRFWSGRRRLKGCLLAVMAGLVDGISDDDKAGKGSLASSTGTSRSKSTAPSPSRAMRDTHPQASASGGAQEGTGTGGLTRRGTRVPLSVSASGGSTRSSTASGKVDTERRRSVMPLHVRKSRGPNYDPSSFPSGMIGSRFEACRLIDREGKGYITAEDLARVVSLMGEDDATAEDTFVVEMMKAVDGDPSTQAESITYEQMARLVPPLCPARVYPAKEALYHEGDVDPMFYLLRKGFVEFSVSTAGGRVPLQTQGPGASFGEVELLRADGSIAPRLATCRCLGDGKGGGCEALVMSGTMFSLLTDVYAGVRSKLGDQAEDRLTQLAGSVLQNGLSGEEQIVSGGQTLWRHHQYTQDLSAAYKNDPRARSTQANQQGNSNQNKEMKQREEAMSATKRRSTLAGNDEEDSASRLSEDDPFALLVLEGSVTAVFLPFEGEDSSATREEVLNPGQFCFCGEGRSFGPDAAPDAPGLVACQPSQHARVLKVPANDFRELMEKRNMAALTEFMLDQ